jgi:hypothetical protein
VCSLRKVAAPRYRRIFNLGSCIPRVGSATCDPAHKLITTISLMFVPMGGGKQQPFKGEHHSGHGLLWVWLEYDGAAETSA